MLCYVGFCLINSAPVELNDCDRIVSKYKKELVESFFCFGWVWAKVDENGRMQVKVHAYCFCDVDFLLFGSNLVVRGCGKRCRGSEISVKWQTRRQNTSYILIEIFFSSGSSRPFKIYKNSYGIGIYRENGNFHFEPFRIFHFGSQINRLVQNLDFY